jgi:hypothetical protein
MALKFHFGLNIAVLQVIMTSLTEDSEEVPSINTGILL